VKHEIGIVGAVVLCTSFFFACSQAAPEADSADGDLTTYLAALSVNGDGSDDTSSTEASDEASEPLVARGCGFSEIVENVVARYDADQSGDLDASEKAELVAEFGDAEAGVPGEHPNRGQPTRAAVLLQAYDSDGSGTLEASEIEALQADIQARCEERRSRLVEEFDTNGDGTLDDAEWEAARAALRERIQEHRRERIAEFDTDGDGTLDADERAALQADLLARRAEVEAEFDADGDGELSDEERAELEEHVRDCVKADVPMESRDAAIERRRHGRLDGIEASAGDEGGEGDGADDIATDTTPEASN
jgi:Ca2+-binding EF-hand superfamily protein